MGLVNEGSSKSLRILCKGDCFIKMFDSNSPHLMVFGLLHAAQIFSNTLVKSAILANIMLFSVLMHEVVSDCMHRNCNVWSKG